ncbi:hypothetical protein FE257_009484 [Aspergillus nanangensis]|uniref:Nucleoside phosphorylase domain-containing protein n=1 Tax=Aspergillus nanangensis TaxID=2582783 RepID=A0AAD4CKH9_ASPNN|nr:hypothetical protein FE257_009484 [Aspergillus nanangensis]
MRPTTAKEFTVAITCALPLEADAVETMFDEVYDVTGCLYDQHPDDTNAYTTGRIGAHNVVLCYLSRIGKAVAARSASNLLRSYTGIQLALTVGICGGAPYTLSGTPIFLGDIIICNSMIDYEYGVRHTPGSFQSHANAANTIVRADRKLQSFLMELEADMRRNGFEDRVLQNLRIAQRSQATWKLPPADDVLFEASYRHGHYNRVAGSSKCPCVTGDQMCEEAFKSIQ